MKFLHYWVNAGFVTGMGLLVESLMRDKQLGATIVAVCCKEIRASWQQVAAWQQGLFEHKSLFNRYL
ncbi:MAG TPA: hypothetical protein VLD59_07380 [Steroidobacteraceae bacterium]|nr:hypothetical protein [Steroidobacteraceae bacterium]